MENNDKKNRWIIWFDEKNYQDNQVIFFISIL